MYPPGGPPQYPQQQYPQSYGAPGVPPPQPPAAGVPPGRGSYPGQQQQPHQQQYYAPQQYGMAPQQQQPYQPQPAPQQMLPPDPLPSVAGGFSPFSLMGGTGGLLSGTQQWGQQYVQKVQQRFGWLTGGAMSHHFSITRAYVLSKLFMLFAPFLKRWTYSRVPEQIQGGQKYRPPRADVNAPDLYIPTMAVWSYALLVCLLRASRHKFSPDGLYAVLWSACVSWLLHLLLATAILRAMALPASVPWLELAAFTGYPFVHGCVSILVGSLTGSRAAYYATWLYGATCSAVFLVRTMKRVVFQETRNYGRDMTMTNYLLLALAAFQYPFIFWLGVGL